MSGHGGKASIVDSLERTEKALQQILQSVQGINSHLELEEARLGGQQNATQLDFIQGAARVIVYSMGGKVQGDPLGNTIKQLIGIGKRLPSFILGSDRSESETTCQGMSHQMRSRLTGTRGIVGLRWSDLPAGLQKNNTIIIGTRFQKGSDDAVESLKEKLKAAGIDSVIDHGEYGGGPVAYTLMQSISDSDGMLFVELTMDATFASDVQKMETLLKTLVDHLM